MSFDEKSCLTMDYDVLRRYTTEAVLKQPSLIALIRRLDIMNAYDGFESNVLSARLRCICAYIGAPDPCKRKKERSN